jgi:SAM-dependent methyltransferase
MGVDIHAFYLLRYVTGKYGVLGNTATLGRQQIFLAQSAFARAGVHYDNVSGYCEPLLTEHFGATRVDSIDNSHYEGATIIADMNLPIPKDLEGQYDVVLDFGCLEHVFDIAQSFRNVSGLCKIGGRILHVLPANQFCGHGFYQFSPEFFFSWYSEKNGYDQVEVFFADMLDTHHWFRVSAPQAGKRINIRSFGKLYVLAVARRMGQPCETAVQQSDYVHEWSSSEQSEPPLRQGGVMRRTKDGLSSYRITAGLIYWLDSLLAENGDKSLRNHPALERIPLKSI